MENLDNRIDWKAFYSNYLKNPSSCGADKMHACCPFHNEKHPSFWFNTKNGCYKCEGCGESGNAITFLEKLTGVTRSDAYKQLQSLAGVAPSTPAAKPTYNVDMYAKEKCFHADWLTAELGISNGSDRAGTHIKIPYKNRLGAVTATRKRYNPAVKPYFKWAKGSKLSFYGLWRLPEAPDSVVLVEGESDTQSLWMLGITALGVPGASNFQAAWCEDLADISNVYLHIEPDMGGETFRKNMIKRLHEGGYKGNVYTFNLNAYGVKDPSELYIKHGTAAADMVKAAMDRAELLDIAELAEELPELVKGMPVLLREPSGWRLSDDGIFRYDKRTESFTQFCRTPIIITNRIRNIDTDEEKIRIAFKKHGTWRTAIYPPTTIYQSRKITELSDIGIMVTSENAKSLVSFLSDLESNNMDKIKEIRSVSQLGWADDAHFLPYAGDGISLDTERNMSSRMAAYKSAGDFDAWRRLMNRHRQRDRFRFIMAAAFAPPLLKLLNQRIFFVYNWGGSEGGKTAALHAALSVWGDPESLKVSFNATKVGLEYTAAFYKDLPLGLNERQLAGDKQESIEQIVYMLAEGSSRIRGTKGGGLQAIKQWRTVVIATGEVELASSTSQTGVSTRVLEIYGGPFENKTEAGEMYPFTAENHGYAGAEFVKNLVTADVDTIKAIHKDITAALSEKVKDRSISHLNAVATIATADVLASRWIWNEPEQDALRRAIDMGVYILLTQSTDKERDVNEKALRFIIDWITANEEKFTGDTYGERLGFERDGKYFIIPAEIETALKRVGYTKTKTLRFLAEKGIVARGADNKFTVRARYAKKQSRFIEFDFDKALSIAQDDSDSLVDLGDADDDEKLPF